MEKHEPKPDSPQRLNSSSLERAFLTDLMKQNKDSNFQEKIYEFNDSINKKVDFIGSTIDNVLKRHEQDFLSAFKSQMLLLHKQLKELKKKNDENEIRLKKDEMLNTLQNSLNWFREEAVKLGESTQFYKNEADKWKAKAESLEDDRNFLETQLKKIKRKLKLLEVEQKEVSLKSSVPSQANLNKFVPSSKTGEIIEDLSSKFSDQVTLLFELEKFVNELEAKHNESIKFLKSCLESEKKKVKQVKAQQNSCFFVKNDLENLFLDCVEEVRKDISRRKAKNLVEQKYQKRAKSSQVEERACMTSFDKRKILEVLIGNEQVLVLLYEKLFPHRGSRFGNLAKDQSKKLDESLPNIEDLLKQVPARPKTMSLKRRGSVV